MPETIISNSAEETAQFAADYAKKLLGGEVIGLIGELGSGKTAFTRGFAKGLGINQSVTSPTFVMMRIYEVKEPVNPESKIKRFCHIDAYRANDSLDIISIGAEDFIGQKDVVTVVEWADKVREILPQRTVYIHFEFQDGNKRLIKY